ncbi:MAG: metallophosphoesterase family protein [Spirochaetes bacterium]|nr:metallophosphoesterase family protein [Spirochaetota bacterium]
MPRFAFLSDLHGDLSPLDLCFREKPDLVILCGDICPKRDVVTTIPLLYVHGNHDNLDTLKRRLPGRNIHLSVETIFGVRILGIGGVFDGDANYIHQIENLTSRRVIAQTTKKFEKVDLIVSHEAPKMAHPLGEIELNSLHEHFQPKLWIHGHHHEKRVSIHGGTKIIGLPWLRKDGSFVIVDM